METKPDETTAEQVADVFARQFAVDEKPLPCPFCGGEAKVCAIGNGHIVACYSPACPVHPHIQFCHRDAHNAIQHWNRRAESPLTQSQAAKMPGPDHVLVSAKWYDKLQREHDEQAAKIRELEAERGSLVKALNKVNAERDKLQREHAEQSAWIAELEAERLRLNLRILNQSKMMESYRKDLDVADTALRLVPSGPLVPISSVIFHSIFEYDGKIGVKTKEWRQWREVATDKYFTSPDIIVQPLAPATITDRQADDRDAKWRNTRWNWGGQYPYLYVDDSLTVWSVRDDTGSKSKWGESVKDLEEAIERFGGFPCDSHGNRIEQQQGTDESANQIGNPKKIHIGHGKVFEDDEIVILIANKREQQQGVGEAAGVSSSSTGHTLGSDQTTGQAVDRTASDAPAARPFCNCELRNRQWNPLTGRCQACGLKYNDTRMNKKEFDDDNKPDPSPVVPPAPNCEAGVVAGGGDEGWPRFKSSWGSPGSFYRYESETEVYYHERGQQAGRIEFPHFSHNKNPQIPDPRPKPPVTAAAKEPNQHTVGEFEYVTCDAPALSVSENPDGSRTVLLSRKHADASERVQGPTAAAKDEGMRAEFDSWFETIVESYSPTGVIRDMIYQAAVLAWQKGRSELQLEAVKGLVESLKPKSTRDGVSILGVEIRTGNERMIDSEKCRLIGKKIDAAIAAFEEARKP